MVRHIIQAGDGNDSHMSVKQGQEQVTEPAIVSDLKTDQCEAVFQMSVNKYPEMGFPWLISSCWRGYVEFTSLAKQ